MERNKLPFSEVLDRIFSDPRGSVSLIYRLSDMSPEETSAFEARWRTEPVEKRRIVARHMADISEENFVVDFSPLLIRLLEDEAPTVRLAAVEGLWDCSNVGAIGPIIRLLEGDAESSVRAAAASCLGHYVLMAEWGQIQQAVGDRVVSALAQQHEAEEMAEEVRRATLEALGNSADPRVRGYIEAAYNHGDDEMQLSAMFAMGRSADSSWTPIIIQEMRSPYAEMREEAARAAGNIGSSDAVDGLIELLEDDELEVQLAAITALGQIGSDQAHEALEELLEDEDAYELHDAAEEAIEEVQWLNSGLDMLGGEWAFDDFDEDDDFE